MSLVRELTVFSREGCHLCELLIEEVEPMCRAAGVALRVHDVDANPAWRECYGTRVPVICADGMELSAGILDHQRVTAWLRTGS